MASQEEGSPSKVRSVFREMTVRKDPRRNRSFAALGIPSYLRDWIIMRFADQEGRVDLEQVREYLRRYIPRREEWELLKSQMIKEGDKVRFLAKVRVEMDVKSGKALFSLPDLGFPARKYEAVIADRTLREHREALLASSEVWGVVELEWIKGFLKENEGTVVMHDFTPFRPYEVDLDFYQEARKQFKLEEWVDVLLMAVDYNPLGFLSLAQKIALLSRLLPFVEKRVNIVELAPKGTGKSYLFSQISKYGWLVSGGSVSRARLFYDLARRTVGLVTHYDYVALDEIQSISFPDEEEVRGALKGYLESGEYRVGDYRGVGEAGIVLLGNISRESMSENRNMFRELPSAFRESALVDRFHGFVRGWDIPRMKESMKAEGWALNVEYFSEIMHALRGDIRYRATVDEMLYVPKGADTRDTEAIKKIATGFLKLLFPNAVSPSEVVPDEFKAYCLDVAKSMRGAIRRQLHAMDPEYGDTLPDITLAVS